MSTPNREHGRMQQRAEVLGKSAVRVQEGKRVKAMSALEKKASHQGQCLEWNRRRTRLSDNILV